MITLSGMSASGKSTLEQAMVSSKEHSFKSLISCTTRLPRPGESDGVEYFFKTKEEFLQMLHDNQLVEYMMFNDAYYGVPFSSIDSLPEGSTGVAVVDPVGVNAIQEYCKTNGHECLSVFIDTSSEECVNRIYSRVNNIHKKGELTPKKVTENAHRIMGIIGPEREWRNMATYHVILRGDDYISDFSRMIDDVLSKHSASGFTTQKKIPAHLNIVKESLTSAIKIQTIDFTAFYLQKIKKSINSTFDFTIL
jgi:guanylate kinase